MWWNFSTVSYTRSNKLSQQIINRERRKCRSEYLLIQNSIAKETVVYVPAENMWKEEATCIGREHGKTATIYLEATSQVQRLV